jgi:hypothetical protein
MTGAILAKLGLTFLIGSILGIALLTAIAISIAKAKARGSWARAAKAVFGSAERETNFELNEARQLHPTTLRNATTLVTTAEHHIAPELWVLSESVRVEALELAQYQAELGAKTTDRVLTGRLTRGPLFLMDESETQSRTRLRRVATN